jgi:hypothetical protein
LLEKKIPEGTWLMEIPVEKRAFEREKETRATSQ